MYHDGYHEHYWVPELVVLESQWYCLFHHPVACLTPAVLEAFLPSDSVSQLATSVSHSVRAPSPVRTGHLSLTCHDQRETLDNQSIGSRLRPPEAA